MRYQCIRISGTNGKKKKITPVYFIMPAYEAVDQKSMHFAALMQDINFSEYCICNFMKVKIPVTAYVQMRSDLNDKIKNLQNQMDRLESVYEQN